MMKLLCVTCMHNRPLVSELFLINMRRLGIDVLAVVSDKASLEVCLRYDAIVFEYENRPLGAKWNYAIEQAVEQIGYTHIMISGDDDIWSMEYVESVDEFQDLPFIGVTSCYMIDPFIELALYFKYKKSSPVVLGGGRVFQRKIVEALVSKGGMFDGSRDRALDASADMRLYELDGLMPFIIDDGRTFVTDVKTKVNIWPLSNFKYLAPEVPYKKAIEHFSLAELKMLKTIKRNEDQGRSGSDI